MPGRRAAKTSWLSLLLVAAAVVLWIAEQKRGAGHSRRPAPAEKSGKTEKAAPANKPSERPTAQRGPQAKSGAYEVHQNCTLAEYRNNDGDSFKVRLADGRVEEFRLYFVDTPESAFKRYAGGDSNHERIRKQAADLGGITPEQAVETGKRAKAFTLGLLEGRPFTLFTCWDSPYQDQRYHAFVEVEEGGRPRWLHELLVERGFARILTKPADLPDGTPAERHKQHLRAMESQAKKAQAGAWGW